VNDESDVGNRTLELDETLELGGFEIVDELLIG
jgi:hypothetical protein